MNKNKNLPQNSETHAASLLVPAKRHFIIPESELNMPYSLTDEHIRFFEENGFVMLRKVFNKETVAAILQVIGPLMDQRVQEMPPEAQRDIYGKAFVANANLYERDPTGEVKRLVFSQRLAMIAAELLQAPGVGFWHDQGLWKPRGSRGTPEHRDVRYWPMQYGLAGTFWLALNDVPRERGGLIFRPGSHLERFPPGEDVEISEESDAYYNKHRRDKDLPRVAMDYGKGDASFHHGRILHGTDANTTDEDRLAFAAIYYNTLERLARWTNQNQRGMYERLTEMAWLKATPSCLSIPLTSSTGRLRVVERLLRFDTLRPKGLMRSRLMKRDQRHIDFFIFKNGLS